jgi:hypothetical protein
MGGGTLRIVKWRAGFVGSDAKDVAAAIGRVADIHYLTFGSMQKNMPSTAQFHCGL